MVSSISGEIHIFSKPGSCDASPRIINSHMPILSSCKYLDTVFFAHPNSISSINIDDSNLLNSTILEGFDSLQSIVINNDYKHLIVASSAGSIKKSTISATTKLYNRVSNQMIYPLISFSNSDKITTDLDCKKRLPDKNLTEMEREVSSVDDNDNVDEKEYEKLKDVSFVKPICDRS